MFWGRWLKGRNHDGGGHGGKAPPSPQGQRVHNRVQRDRRIHERQQGRDERTFSPEERAMIRENEQTGRTEDAAERLAQKRREFEQAEREYRDAVHRYEAEHQIRAHESEQPQGQSREGGSLAKEAGQGMLEAEAMKAAGMTGTGMDMASGAASILSRVGQAETKRVQDYERPIAPRPDREGPVPGG